MALWSWSASPQESFASQGVEPEDSTTLLDHRLRILGNRSIERRRRLGRCCSGLLLRSDRVTGEEDQAETSSPKAVVNAE
jgi:hypothetical protein